MKYIDRILILLMLLPIGLTAQVQMIDMMYECGSEIYLFKINDQAFTDGSKAFVCLRNLPIGIELVDNEDIPLHFDEITWTNADVDLDNVAEATLTEAHFGNNNQITIIVNFNDDLGGDVELKLKVNRTTELKLKEHNADIYSYDDNKIEEYPTYQAAGVPAEVPWKFLQYGMEDRVRTDVNPDKAFYAPRLEATDLDLSATPVVLPESHTDINLQYFGNNNMVVDVSGCRLDPELRVFPAPLQTVQMEFFRLCESDDDVQMHLPGTPVMNPAVVCIDPGADNSPDGNRDEWLSPNDEMVLGADGRYYVIAGPDMICDSEARPPALDCPANLPVDINALINNNNAIYNAVGVQIAPVNVNVIDLAVNYDFSSENGLMSLNEQHLLNDLRELMGDLNDDVMECWIVESLGESGGNVVAGRASGFGENTVALAQAGLNINSTLAHEIGHARFELRHPKDQFPTMTGNNADKKNFMYFTNTGRTNNIRAYQFSLIH